MSRFERECRAFMFDALRHGPVPAADLAAEAAERGFEILGSALYDIGAVEVDDPERGLMIVPPASFDADACIKADRDHLRRVAGLLLDAGYDVWAVPDAG